MCSGGRCTAPANQNARQALSQASSQAQSDRRAGTMRWQDALAALVLAAVARVSARPSRPCCAFYKADAARMAVSPSPGEARAGRRSRGSRWRGGGWPALLTAVLPAPAPGGRPRSISRRWRRWRSGPAGRGTPTPRRACAWMCGPSSCGAARWPTTRSSTSTSTTTWSTARSRCPSTAASAAAWTDGPR